VVFSVGHHTKRETAAGAILRFCAGRFLFGGIVFYKHFSEVPRDGWNWPHFQPKELASRGDGSLLVDAASLDCLESLRRAIGRPLTILSAYRDPLHNARVGGAPMSQHKFGRAFDIRLSADVERDLLNRLARDAGFTGFGNYNTFVHVDTGSARQWKGE
jgi:hypothetical protein